MDFSVSKVFHPVGQGLFSSATLRVDGEDTSKDYVWVYDCGNHWAQPLVMREVDRFASAHTAIDMLVISHFDADHISGVSRLIGKSPTRRIMLPYMDLAQRLILAFDQGLTGAEEIAGFYLNPAAYLAEQAGDPSIEFLFVPPSSPDGPPTVPGEDVAPTPDGFLPYGDMHRDAETKSGILRETVEYSEPIPEAFGPEINAMRHSQIGTSGYLPKIAMLRQRGRIVVERLWEFIPYNDPLPKPRNLRLFSKEVERSRDRLLTATSDKDREERIQQLKQLYDKHLSGRRTSDKRNRGSLFLFEGPLHVIKVHACALLWPATFPGHPRPVTAILQHCLAPICTTRTARSFMMTGDGFLKKSSELDNLKRYFGPARMADILALQVMHHGSRYNWHKGIANDISPSFSIFSADPSRQRPGHPSPVVLADFKRFNPMIADQHDGILVCASYLR